MAQRLAMFHWIYGVDLLADVSADEAIPLIDRLAPQDRIRAMAAIVVVITVGGLLLLLIRAAGKITRWYVNRPLRSTRLTGDPFKMDHDKEMDGDQHESLQPPSSHETRDAHNHDS